MRAAPFAVFVVAGAVLAGCLAADDDGPSTDETTPAPPGPVSPAVPTTATNGSDGTDAPLRLVAVATGLQQPTLVTHTGTATDGLYVLEQRGVVRIVRADLIGIAADLTDRVGSDASERGLLGLAFPPDFAARRVAFVDYTDLAGNTVVSRFPVRADGSFDTGAETVLLQVEQPFANHNGGHLAFGPDGMLYVGLGDGGLAGDPRLNGQNPATLLGSILRLDVSAGIATYAVPPDNPFADDPLFAAEVWVYGLRNPWRFSFDRATGDLWIADVGQDAVEEIDFLPAAGPGMAPAGGANFGWNLYEGLLLYPAGIEASLLADVFTFPVAQYGHDEGCSVTGGHVFRGPTGAAPSGASGDAGALAALTGQYVYADFCAGTVWTLAGPTAAPQALMDTGLPVSSFGEDAAGSLYLVDYGGTVYRFA